MANLSKTTQDHKVIQRWAEERGGKPSHVKSTGQGSDVGILRIDFPGYSGEGSLEEISWDQWFDKFDERNLALLFEEETAGGERSNFNKIVTAETAEANERGSQRKAGGSKSPSGRTTSSKKSVVKKGSAPSKKGGTKPGAVKKGAKTKAALVKNTAAKKAVKKSASKKSGGGSSAKKAAPKKAAVKKAGPTKKSAASKKRGR